MAYKERKRIKNLEFFAKEYISQGRSKVAKENSLTDDDGNPIDYVDPRTPYQRWLVNQIIKRVQPFMYRIAKKMLYGGGVKMPLGNGKYSILSLNNFSNNPNITVDDLVNDGNMGIMENMHTYKVMDKSSIMSFLKLYAAQKMHRSAIENAFMVRINDTLYKKIIGTIRAAEDTEAGVEALNTELKSHKTQHPRALALQLYNMLNNRYHEIKTPIDPDAEHSISYEEAFLPGQDYREASLKAMQTAKTYQWISRIDDQKDKDIIESRCLHDEYKSVVPLRELAAKYDVSPNAIHLREKKVIKDMRQIAEELDLVA